MADIIFAITQSEHFLISNTPTVYTGSESSSYAETSATASYLLGSISSASYSTYSETASLLIGSVESASYAETSSFVSSIDYTNVSNKPSLVSGSQQISSEISGSFTSVSSSVENRITNVESSISTLEGKSLLSSSVQIASDISGSFLSDSSSLASRITTNTSDISILNNKSLLSSSLQIASDISGSFNSISSSLSSRTATNESSISILTNASSSFASDINSLENDSGSISIRITNSETTSSNLITASSSLSLRLDDLETYSGIYTGSFSGSFIGSITSASYAQTASVLLGSIESSSYAENSATASILLGSVESASYASSVEYDNITSKPTLVSSSAQISNDISGSFTSTSSSLASRITSNESDISTLNSKTLFSSSEQVDYSSISNIPSGILSSSTQISNDISGSFTSVSSSLSSRIVINENDIDSLQIISSSYLISSASVSQSIVTLTNSSSSFSSRVTNVELTDSSLTSASSSFASNINTLFNASSSYAISSASFSSSIASLNSKSLISASAQIANDISGSFSTVSSSFTHIKVSGSNTGFESNIISFVGWDDWWGEWYPYIHISAITSGSDKNSYIRQNVRTTWFLPSTGQMGPGEIDDQSLIFSGSSKRFVFNSLGQFSGDATDLTATGSFTGSFKGDGSSLTGIIASGSIDSSSYSDYAVTSSYATNAVTFSSSFESRITTDESNITTLQNASSSFASDISILNSKTLLSSSAQIANNISGSFTSPSNSIATEINALQTKTDYTGSFTGSFIGDGSSLTGIISSSFAITASYALNGGSTGSSGDISGTANYISKFSDTDSIRTASNFQQDSSGNLIIGNTGSASSFVNIFKSGSSVFKVQGSFGTLFEITDEENDNLLEVLDNNDNTVLTISESISDRLVISGNILPNDAGIFNIGSSTKPFNTLYGTSSYEPVKTITIPHTWGVSTPSSSIYIVPFFVSASSGQTMTITNARYKLQTGGVTASLFLNDSAIYDYTSMSIGTTATSKVQTQSLSNNDELRLVVHGQNDSPANLTFTVFIQNEI